MKLNPHRKIRIKRLKEQDAFILETLPETRDDDILLWLQLIRKYYSHMTFKDNEEKQCVMLRKILDMPKQYDVQRYRTHIQNVEKKFLPTKESVVRARRQNVEVWRLVMRDLKDKALNEPHSSTT